MRFHFRAEMFQYGLHGRGDDLAEAADRGLAHCGGEIVNKFQVRGELRFAYAALRPTSENLDHFLRAHAARNTLAAGFVAIKFHGVQGHVQHAGGVVANHDGAGAEHGAGIGQRFEVQFNFDH